MPDTSKDFTPIRRDYAFFETHSDEAESDLDAYAEQLGLASLPAGVIRMLDFGCGPGTFSKRFLERVAWGKDRLDLALVEPSAVYRQQAVELLETMTARPLRAWSALPEGVGREFDVILSNHALYYVPELEAVLARLVAALDRNGVFLAAIAGRDNTLVDFWYRAFAMIDRPVPYHNADDVAAALTRLGRPFERNVVQYTLTFPDTLENRLSILRFLLGEHLAEMPRGEVLQLFDPYSSAGQVTIQTGNKQYYVRVGS